MNRPNPLEAHLGYWLRCLSNLVSESFAARLERHGITVAQWVTLRILYDHESLTLIQAAELVGVDKSSLSRMVERLVLKGRVIRTGHEADRRAVSLSLSAAGRKLVPVLAQEADDNDHTFFQSLPAAQKDALLKTIQSLLKANGWDVSTHGKSRLS